MKPAPQKTRHIPVLGDGGPGSLSQEAAIGDGSREGACLLGAQSAAEESWVDHPAEGVGQGSQEPAADENGVPQYLAAWDQQVQIGGHRPEAGVPSPRRDGAASDARPSDACLDPDAVQGESDEGVAPSKEGKTEASDAGPRLMPARLEALKGSEQPGGVQLGDLRSTGQTAQGEAAAAAGREGASLKQDAPVDLPSRPATPHVTSNLQMPVNPAHAASAGSFRVFRDTVHMHILDEKLGPMHWQIHMNGGSITAEAVVETSRVQALLQNHHHVLESRLNALGVEVHDFDVSVDQGSQNFYAFSEQNGSGTAHGSTLEPFFETSPDTHVLKAYTTPDQGVDLYA